MNEIRYESYGVSFGLHIASEQLQSFLSSAILWIGKQYKPSKHTYVQCDETKTKVVVASIYAVPCTRH